MSVTAIAGLYEALLEAEGLGPEPTVHEREIALEEVVSWGDASDALHDLLVEVGMGPEEFLLTVEQNRDALITFLTSRMGPLN